MKHWTEEEMQYLSEAWGKTSTAGISKKLGRSVCAIKLKAGRMQLGAFLESGEYVTFNQLLAALGINNSQTYKTISLIKKRNLPVKMQKVHNEKIKVIKIENFWKWAEKNQDILDFSKFQKNMLGIEPEWVEGKRKADEYKAKRYQPKKKWTAYEDERLAFMVKQKRYTYTDISHDLKRTYGAIERRLKDLGIKERPLRENVKTWTNEEIEAVESYILNGLNYEIISEKLRRSVKAIRGQMYHLHHTESLDKIREIIGGAK